MRRRPLCLDGLEATVAANIVDEHDRLAASRGFNPELAGRLREDAEGLVASVVASSFCTFFGSPPEERYGDVFEQVADFAAHLAKGHIFPDANKRTTVVAVGGALHLAGFVLEHGDESDPERNLLYRWVQDVVTGDRSPAELVEVLRANCRAEEPAG